MVDFQVERSRATSPLFYRAPHPENVTPMEYQFAGAEYALNREHCLIGDAPGTGKTAESILLGNAIEAKHTLVVCPASLRLNWEREIWMWSMLENVSTYPILKGRDGVSLDANYVITSYNLLSNPSILNALMDVRWDHLILDEAHNVKNPEANRSRIICAPDLLPSVVDRITMLSGTILPNRPDECYNAIRLLDWDAIDCMSLEAFRNEYYEMGEGYVRKKVQRQINGQTVNRFENVYSDKVRNVPCNLADLQYRLRKNIMVRRLKEHVLSQLPKKVWHPIPVELDAGIRKALKHPGWKEAEKLYEMDPNAFASIPVDGAIGTARRLLGEAKVPAVVRYLEELRKEGLTKIVVAAWHKTVLSAIRQKLDKYGCVYMDGDTSPRNKQAAVDEFQDNPACGFILGQMIPLKEGWTLTAAQDCVAAEVDWVPGNNDQFFDRINRIGQSGGYTTCHLPIVPDTLDERVLGSAISKDQNIYQALDAPLY